MNINRNRSVLRNALIVLGLLAFPAAISYAEHTDDLAFVSYANYENETDSDFFTLDVPREVTLDAEVFARGTNSKPGGRPYQIAIFVDGEEVLAWHSNGYDRQKSVTLTLEPGEHTLSAELKAGNPNSSVWGDAVIY